MMLQDGRYLVTADPRRGTIEVNWTPSSSSSSSNGVLKIEWKDRRTRAVVDSHTIFPEDNCTYEKVETGNEKDRVYLLQYGNVSDRRSFFWMQDKEEGNLDEENCVKINSFIADPAEAAAAANGEESPSANATTDGLNRTSANARGGLDSDALREIMQGIAPSSGSGNESANNNNSQGGGQVDALSNILQNLGMPQQSSSSSNADSSSNVAVATPAPPSNATSTPAAPSRGLGGLTLSDLQGAMAGLATTSPSSQGQAGPPLNQIVTADAITDSGILENEEIKNKLIALLPEGQRTEEKLMENLRSPQVAQCLKSLTAALNEDASFNSILANFQLDPKDGAAAMASGNPIQAFLDCVLKSVEKEKEENNDNEESKDQDGDSEMKE